MGGVRFMHSTCTYSYSVCTCTYMYMWCNLFSSSSGDTWCSVRGGTSHSTGLCWSSVQYNITTFTFLYYINTCTFSVFHAKKEEGYFSATLWCPFEKCAL